MGSLDQKICLNMCIVIQDSKKETEIQWDLYKEKQFQIKRGLDKSRQVIVKKRTLKISKYLKL